MRRAFSWPMATGGRCIKCKKIIWEAKQEAKGVWDSIKSWLGYGEKQWKYCGKTLCISTGEAPITKQKIAEHPTVHPFSGKINHPTSEGLKISKAPNAGLEPNAPTKAKKAEIFKMS